MKKYLTGVKETMLVIIKVYVKTMFLFWKFNIIFVNFVHLKVTYTKWKFNDQIVWANRDTETILWLDLEFFLWFQNLFWLRDFYTFLITQIISITKPLKHSKPNGDGACKTPYPLIVQVEDSKSIISILS